MKTQTKQQLITLAIDTSCDETCAAVTCGWEVWSNVVASQIELHRPYGGVFPTIAKQAHQENIRPVVKAALQRSHSQLADVEQIAVTIGPGLAPALEVGINYAQELAQQIKKPLLAINHIEAHLLSPHALARPKMAWQNLVSEKQRANKKSQQHQFEFSLPALGLVVSGGHTMFILVEKKSLLNNSEMVVDRQPNLNLTLQAGQPGLNSGQFQYTVLGQTIDDAAGEALDKIGRLLNLGYPAGPVMEQLAKAGNPRQYDWPLPMTNQRNYNLSFSGLKTNTRNFIETNWGQKQPTKQEVCNLAASIQYAIFRHICYKLNKILQKNPQIKNIWLGGGVAANLTLRKMIRQTLKKQSQQSKLLNCNPRQLLVPNSKKLCGDNAAMIGLVAAHSSFY